MVLTKLLLRNINKNFQLSSRDSSNNPITRTWKLLTQDIKSTFNKEQPVIYPEHADVVIIGGGFIGASAAYWLKSRAGEGLSVVVLDKDLTYSNSQNILSHGLLTQHFSLLENIQLSQCTIEFMRNIKEHWKSSVDLQFCPTGYLLLASEKYAEKLEQTVAMQKDYGIKNKILTVQQIKRKYPWINTDDISLGCISSEGEGVFNSNRLFQGFKQRSLELGANYVNAEVVGFELEQQRDILMEGIVPGSFKKINYVTYKTADNEEHRLKFAVCILAAGADSADVAKLAKIGEIDGLLKVPLPIEKREYNVYSIDNINEMTLGLNAPYIMDTSGLWLRRNGLQNNLICGLMPSLIKDSNYTESEIFQSSLLNRYPNCKNSEVKVISTESNDFNTYDDTGILGPHVYHTNIYIAAGFGRNGVSHSPGIGKALAELIIDGHYTSLDLTRLAFDRMLMSEPLIDINVY